MDKIVSYVKLVDPSTSWWKKDKFISGARVGRIYKVVEVGVDYYKIVCNGRPRIVDKCFGEISSRDQYLEQDKPVREEEDFSEYEEV